MKGVYFEEHEIIYLIEYFTSNGADLSFRVLGVWSQLGVVLWITGLVNKKGWESRN